MRIVDRSVIVMQYMQLRLAGDEEIVARLLLSLLVQYNDVTFLSMSFIENNQSKRVSCQLNNNKSL